MLSTITKKFLHFLIFLNAIIAFSQVGIGTTAPSETLDINGSTRVRSLSNSVNETNQVFARPDGTLVTGSSDPNIAGPRFVGFLPQDLDFDENQEFFEIVLSDEIVDLRDEYNISTGRYTPSASGVYKVSMDFDIGGYASTNVDIDILIGLWDFTTDEWVVRRTFKYRDIESDEFSNPRQESFGITNYSSLIIGNSYGFRTICTYDSSIDDDERTAILLKENIGGTGSSKSTSFSIEKVQ